MSRVWHYSISNAAPKGSLMIALVVGTIVNLINQADALVARHSLDVTKLLATYVVSYFVGTYAAVSYCFHIERQAMTNPSLH
jgi:hypothetical protein